MPFPFTIRLIVCSLKVQSTITQIQDKFGQMSDSIMTRSKLNCHIDFEYSSNLISVDDMGRRIDDLERNIAHIISQTNAELP